MKISKIALLLFTILVFLISSNVLAQEVIINEIMASNQQTIKDNDSDFEDWLELKNISQKTINLSGYYLSDNFDEIDKWRFKNNESFILKPGETLLIWTDDEVDEGNFHTNFKLSNSGENVILTKPDGTTIVDQIEYPKIDTDVSYGRSIFNRSKWRYFVFPTPDSENNIFGFSNYNVVGKFKFVKDHILFSSIFLFSFLTIFMLLVFNYKNRIKLKSSRIRYKELFEESPIGIIRCSNNGDILDVNDYMVRLLGAPSKKEVKDFKIFSLIGLSEGWGDLLPLDNKKEITGETEYISYWGKELILKYKVGILSSLDYNFEVIITASDISKEKNTENKLKFLSFHDELTGLYNRRYFEKEMERLSRSRNIPISILIGDLDNLKYINDTFGHKKGDEYIIRAAEIIRNNFREEDIAARIGGDEFAVILPNTNLKTVKGISDRIKSNCVSDQQFKFLSISIGYSTKINATDDLNQILIQADKKLYEDKKTKKKLRKKACN